MWIVLAAYLLGVVTFPIAIGVIGYFFDAEARTRVQDTKRTVAAQRHAIWRAASRPDPQ